MPSATLAERIRQCRPRSRPDPDRPGGPAPADPDVDRIVAAVTGPGEPDPVACAELLARGDAGAERFLREVTGCTDAVARAAVSAVAALDVRVTGAEAVAALLAQAGVRTVFGYGGTSELALLDALDAVPGPELINGRGDKESAFMAAGASLLRPNHGAAVLHGARGLTNAAGGVVDARRTEAGTVYLVGLPSSTSERFLPPHAETGLRSTMEAFADWAWQAPAVPADPARRRQAARRFVTRLLDALAAAAAPPHRPAIFAIPQDVAEGRWIRVADLAARGPEPATTDLGQPAVDAAARALGAARRPVFLLDDYALRHDGLRGALDALSAAVGGVVLQLRYRRGPMLFERIRPDEGHGFCGWLNQFSAVHRRLLDEADLLVTVEDRNIYERVAGRLPGCRKVAVNSDPEKVLKNEYLGEDDPLVVGNPVEVLVELARRLPPRAGAPAPPWFPAPEVVAAGAVTPEPASAAVRDGRQGIAAALGRTLAGWRRPVLVDDSQMFGGLVAEGYDELPPGLRVFGSHGGFVGGGLPVAAGLAIAERDVRVMCTLGDQAFTNSLQSLVAVVQQRARVLLVVCNNGESVSLTKQAVSSLGERRRGYLANVDGFSYCALAGALGVPAHRVVVPLGEPAERIAAALAELAGRLDEAARVDGPALVELVVPGEPEAWRGIWLTQGFEQRAPVSPP